MWESWSAPDSLQMVLWVHAAAVALPAAEHLSLHAEFGDRGAFAWKVFRAAAPTRGVAAVQHMLFGRAGVIAMLWLQLGSALVMTIAPSRSGVQWIALAVSTLLLLLMTARQRYGQDGADQMTLIVGITCVLTFGPFASDTAVQIGLWFIALQAALAYLSAGTAKVVSSVWRRGLAVGLVVDTASYGSRVVSDLLRRHAWLGKAATWGTLLFEMTFVFALVGPWQLTAGILVAGVMFHLGIAVVMGLNNFVPAFLSTYPAVLWVSLAS